MVEQGCPWPTLPSGQRKSVSSLCAEARALFIQQTGREPELILMSHELEHEITEMADLRFCIEHRYMGKVGKYYRGIRFMVTSDVQLALA